MATDPQSLFDEAGCIVCYSPNEYSVELAQIETLVEIEESGGITPISE